ncbi:hypothetical protein [Tianweitania sp.]|uniref:hypothetical protein n=1 Tax=Tianweitania sp. TaxID=2021634 RepID=UPI00289D1264|nr:hypothetical protein [Tianweitania sp.]
MVDLKRRQVAGGMVFGLPLFLTSTSLQAKPAEILRVNGDVSAANYGGLESFLFNSVDKLIGLKIRFEANPDAEPGTVSASQDGDLFIAYLRKDEPESQISAKAGVNFQNGGYVLDGFFTVKDAGMNQGITALFLEKSDSGAVLAANPAIKDIEIGRLKAEIRD